MRLTTAVGRAWMKMHRILFRVMFLYYICGVLMSPAQSVHRMNPHYHVYFEERAVKTKKQDCCDAGSPGLLPPAAEEACGSGPVCHGRPLRVSRADAHVTARAVLKAARLLL